MTCEEIRDGEGKLVAIACGRPRSRRICDVCDRPASPPTDKLKDGTPFDDCITCRKRISAARVRAAAGLPPIDGEWLTYAAERIRTTNAREVPRGRV